MVGFFVTNQFGPRARLGNLLRLRIGAFGWKSCRLRVDYLRLRRPYTRRWFKNLRIGHFDLPNKTRKLSVTQKTTYFSNGPSNRLRRNSKQIYVHYTACKLTKVSTARSYNEYTCAVLSAHRIKSHCQIKTQRLHSTSGSIDDCFTPPPASDVPSLRFTHCS